MLEGKRAGKRKRPQSGTSAPDGSPGTAVVAVVQAAASETVAAADPAQDASKACSTTHRTEWARFIRLSSNHKRFPMELQGELKTDKLGLFRKWLSQGEDINMVLQMSRTATKEDESTHEFMYAKRRDLEGRPWILPKAKADALCAKKRNVGSGTQTSRTMKKNNYIGSGRQSRANAPNASQMR